MLPYDEHDRTGVLEDLESADEEVRRLAVERIDALADEEILPRLIVRLGDSDWRVRKAAVNRISTHFDSQEATGSLIAALGDGENPGRRNAAVEALVALAESAVEALCRASDDDDPDVRKFVVDALAGIGSKNAVSPLVDRREDVDPNVRAAVADALGAIGGEVARRALRDTATNADEESLVRFSALHALDTLEEPLRADELASVLGDPMLGPVGLGLLGRCEEDPGALEALLKGLASGVRAARESSMRSILRLAARADGSALDALRTRLAELNASDPAPWRSAIERLGDADLETQLALVQFLGLVHAREAVIPILEAGRDEALAQVAIGALEAMGDVAVVEIDAAWRALDVDRRCAACELLGRLGGETAFARLLASLDDLDPTLRTAAAEALASLGDTAALDPLVRRLGQAIPDEPMDGDEERRALGEAIVALTGPDASGRSPAIAERAVALLAGNLAGARDDTRVSIARVLGCIARREDAELIAMLMRDPSPEVRRAAVDAIARFDLERTPEPLRLAIADESPMVRVAAARALGASRHDAAFEDLVRLAEDEDPRVRAMAVDAIGRRFGADAAPSTRARALAVLGRACDDEAPVALSVATAARAIGGDATSYVAPLLARPEPEVVLAAVACVGVHAAAEELDVLLPLVAHPDWSVRAEVIEILGERRYRHAVPAILRRLETEQDEVVRNITLTALQQLEA